MAVTGSVCLRILFNGLALRLKKPAFRADFAAPVELALLAPGVLYLALLLSVATCALPESRLLPSAWGGVTD
jgi:hypothetical protein